MFLCIYMGVAHIEQNNRVKKIIKIMLAFYRGVMYNIYNIYIITMLTKDFNMVYIIITTLQYYNLTM